MTSASLEVSNFSGTLVYRRAAIDSTSGAHSTTWDAGKWNQAPHAGAFANPNNSHYETKIVGQFRGEACDSEPVSLTTKIVVEADITDERPAGSTVTHVAGLDDMVNALKIVMKSGSSETIVPALGNSTVTDKSGGSTTSVVKSIKVDAPALNSLSDGSYEVLFRDLRDEIGNFGDADGNPANGIQEYSFPLELR